jgi:hypothetical protein
MLKLGSGSSAVVYKGKFCDAVKKYKSKKFRRHFKEEVKFLNLQNHKIKKNQKKLLGNDQPFNSSIIHIIIY